MSGKSLVRFPARASILVVILAAVGILAVNCSGTHDSSKDPLTVGGARNTVDIKSFEYVPGNLQIPAGATITFVNHDNAPHTATANDGSWDTGTLDKDDSKSITFDKPGEYLYHCRVHPTMKGRIEVRAGS